MNANVLFRCLREWRASDTARSFLLHNEAAVNLLAVSNLAPDGFVQTTCATTAASTESDDTTAAAAVLVASAASTYAKKDVTSMDDTTTSPASMAATDVATSAGADVVARTTVTHLVLRARCCAVDTVVDESEREALSSLEMSSLLLMDDDDDCGEGAENVRGGAHKRPREADSTGRVSRQRHLLHALLRRAHDTACVRHSGLLAARLFFGVQSLSLHDSLLVRAHCAATEAEETVPSPSVPATTSAGTAAPPATRTVKLLPRATPPSAVRTLMTPTLEWFDVGDAGPTMPWTTARLRYQGSNTHPLILTSLLRLKRARDAPATVSAAASSPSVNTNTTPSTPAATTHVPQNDAEAHKVAEYVAVLMQLHGFAALPAGEEARLDVQAEDRCVCPPDDSGCAAFKAIACGGVGWDWVQWSVAPATVSPDAEDVGTETAVVTGPQAAAALWTYLSHISVRREEGSSGEDTASSSWLRSVRCHYCGALPRVELWLRRQPLWETFDVSTSRDEGETTVTLKEEEAEDSDELHETLSVLVGSPSRSPTPRDEGDDDDIPNAHTVNDDTHAPTREPAPEGCLNVTSLTAADVERCELPAEEEEQAPAEASQDRGKHEHPSGAASPLPPPPPPARQEQRLIGYRLVDVEATLTFLAHNQFQTHHNDCPWHAMMLSSAMDTFSDRSTSLLPKPMDFWFERPAEACTHTVSPDEPAQDSQDLVDESPCALPLAPVSSAARSPSPTGSHALLPAPAVRVCVRFQRDEVACLLTCWGRSEDRERHCPRRYLAQPLRQCLQACRRDGSLYTAPARLTADDGSARALRAESRLEAFLAELDATAETETVEAPTLVHYAETGESVDHVVSLLQRARQVLAEEAGVPEERSDPDLGARESALEAAEHFLRARTYQGTESAELVARFSALQAKLAEALPLSPLQTSTEEEHSAARWCQRRLPPHVTTLAATALVSAQYGPAFLPRLVASPATTEDPSTSPTTAATESRGADAAAATETNAGETHGSSPSVPQALLVVPSNLVAGLRTPSLLSSEEGARVREWLSTHVPTLATLCSTKAPVEPHKTITPTPVAPAPVMAPSATRAPPPSAAPHPPPSQSGTPGSTSLNPHAQPFNPPMRQTNSAPPPPTSHGQDPRTTARPPSAQVPLPSTAPSRPPPPPPPQKVSAQKPTQTTPARDSRGGILGMAASTTPSFVAQPRSGGGPSSSHQTPNTQRAASTHASPANAPVFGHQPATQAAPVFGQASRLPFTPAASAFNAPGTSARGQHNDSGATAPSHAPAHTQSVLESNVPTPSTSVFVARQGPTALNAGNAASQFGSGQPLVSPSPTGVLASPAQSTTAALPIPGSTPPARAAPVIVRSTVAGTPSTGFRSILGSSHNSSGGGDHSQVTNSSILSTPSPQASFSHASPSLSRPPQSQGLLGTPPPPPLSFGSPTERPTPLGRSPGGGGGFGAFAQSTAGRGFTFQASQPAGPQGGVLGAVGTNRTSTVGSAEGAPPTDGPVFGYRAVSGAPPQGLAGTLVPPPGRAPGGSVFGFGQPSVFGSSGHSGPSS